MTTVPPLNAEYLADLVRQLGDVPLTRIRLVPPVGTATEQDLLSLSQHPEKKLCELADGTLVEKIMGAKESLLAMYLGHLIHEYLSNNDLGHVLGPDGAIRLMQGLVRMPDVSFISYERLPEGNFPEDPLLDVAPNLAVEILSPSNTANEMQRKIGEYFQHGVTLVWLIDPESQSAEAYRSPTDVRTIQKTDNLDGEDVLPNFTLPLADLFARLRQRPKKG